MVQTSYESAFSEAVFLYLFLLYYLVPIICFKFFVKKLECLNKERIKAGGEDVKQACIEFQSQWSPSRAGSIIMALKRD